MLTRVINDTTDGFTNSSAADLVNGSTKTDHIGLASDLWLTTIYGIIYPPLVIMIVLGNTLVILAFTTTKSLRKASSYFLISLAVTDLLTGIISIPCHLIGRLIVSPVTCWSSTRFFFFTPTVILSAASLYHLIAIAIDRLISVYKPLQHSFIVTPFRVQVVLVILWVYNICFGLLPVIIPDASEPEWTCRAEPYGQELNIITLVIAGFIPLYFVVMIALYAIMLRKVANHITRHSQLTKQVQTQRHGLVTMAMIVGAFGLCFMPSSFLYVYEVYGNYTMKKLIIIQTVCEFPVFLNSMVNPMIYCLRNDDLNKAMRGTALRITGRCQRSRCYSGSSRYGSTIRRKRVNRQRKDTPPISSGETRSMGLEMEQVAFGSS